VVESLPPPKAFGKEIFAKCIIFTLDDLLTLASSAFFESRQGSQWGRLETGPTANNSQWARVGAAEPSRSGGASPARCIRQAAVLAPGVRLGVGYRASERVPGGCVRGRETIFPKPKLSQPLR
jgi:hypothetical protein